MAQSRSGTRPALYDDLLALPDHVVGEIIGGELVVSPRPTPRHSVATSVLGGELGPPYHSGSGGPGGWWILDEPELHLDEDVVVPDWICEVLSPSTARLDRHKKLALYARAGVSHAWLVDPVPRTLEVLRLEHQQWVIVSVHAGDEDVRAEPFEATPLVLRRLWVD